MSGETIKSKYVCIQVYRKCLLRYVCLIAHVNLVINKSQQLQKPKYHNCESLFGRCLFVNRNY